MLCADMRVPAILMRKLVELRLPILHTFRCADMHTTFYWHGCGSFETTSQPTMPFMWLLPKFSMQRYSLATGAWPRQRGVTCVWNWSNLFSEGAEGVGFEPTIRFPVYTLSKRAP